MPFVRSPAKLNGNAFSSARLDHHKVRWWGNILLALMSVVFSIVIFEVALRALPIPYLQKLRQHHEAGGGAREVHPKNLYTLHPEIGWTLTPGFSGQFQKEDFSIRIDANQQGIRNENVGPRGADTKRILGLGDSFAFGWGVENKQSFLKLLEEKLNSSQIVSPSLGTSAHNGKRYEVVNAGIPGFGTYEALRLLENISAEYRPDLVMLSFYEGNDYKNNGDAPRKREIRNGYLADVAYKKHPLIKFAVDHSILALLIESRVSSLKEKMRFSKNVEKTEQYLLQMHEFLLKKNIPFVFLFIPDQDETVYERSAWLRRYDRLWGGMDLFEARTKIEQFCRRNGIAYYRLSNAFEDAEISNLLRLKDTHFNELGHKQAAEEIFQFMSKTLDKEILAS